MFSCNSLKPSRCTKSPREHGSISVLDTRQHFDLAAQMIHAAQRPVLYVGGGIVKARAHADIRELAERAGLPVTSTLMALGALPAGHSLDIGMLGMHGARYTNLIIDECDLLIAIGARFDDRATGDPKTLRPARPHHSHRHRPARVRQDQGGRRVDLCRRRLRDARTAEARATDSANAVAPPE